MLLRVAGLTKRFGGVVANHAVTFDVAPGELVGIIGPNGAGKSTLFDLVTGFARPDAGRVAVDGRDVTRLRPDEICRLGVARTFQKLRPFAGMTALENVMVGAFQRTGDVGEARDI
ncbi:MAG TPA: ATP-binding cassette domain-containing protein, partial [Methylomirabilota bacterium]|nr:ATP-binding cassette domain-containing protein [Methylomirabilota bacterium]